jgi:hypothetical protein
MTQHRQIVSKQHQGVGREVISLDWTLSHHEEGLHIDGVKRAYDYVNHCMSNYQTVVTATIANPQQLDGIAVEVQLPDFKAAEKKVFANDCPRELRRSRAINATFALGKWSRDSDLELPLGL